MQSGKHMGKIVLDAQSDAMVMVRFLTRRTPERAFVNHKHRRPLYDLILLPPVLTLLTLSLAALEGWVNR